LESVDQKVFSEHEEVLVNVVANQAASAIQNARLYQAEEQRSKELAEAHERLKQLNETLEERVRQRTRELEHANRELMEAQARLVQSGTLASLGKMVAGVAQEINTPVSAIHSSGDSARRAIAILRGALAQQAASTETGSRSVSRALEVMEDTHRLIQQGTERVVRVIRSLKTFSRLDMADLADVDLHEGLESAIALLWSAIPEKIAIVKNYGDLPSVRCYAAQINQVFLNVLTNAAQAIDQEGTITIRTAREDNHAVVEISDTGEGIAPGHIQKIFDPGFTTRGVGVGLGLGLSIAYRILENHHGSIQVHSEAGKGSTFTIRLPIRETPSHA
jgi:signal transduction histidine kinase